MILDTFCVNSVKNITIHKALESFMLRFLIVLYFLSLHTEVFSHGFPLDLNSIFYMLQKMKNLKISKCDGHV